MQGSSAEPLFCFCVVEASVRLFGLESTLDGQGFGSFSDCSFSGLDFVVRLVGSIFLWHTFDRIDAKNRLFLCREGATRPCW